MNVNFIKNKCKNAKVNFDFAKIGNLVGHGAEGYVYEYENDKVIKFARFGFLRSIKKFEKLYQKIKGFKVIPKVYLYGSYDNYYWIVMEKLPDSLSKKEASLVDRAEHTLTSFLKILSVLPKKEAQVCQSKEWKSFVKSSKILHTKYGCNHLDFYSGNLRKDAKGKIKMIDFESFFP